MHQFTKGNQRNTMQQSNRNMLMALDLVVALLLGLAVNADDKLRI